MKDKIKVIDEIVTRHQSYGVEKGWSWYTGGMKDTGDWYYRKMLDVSLEELQLFLTNIVLGEIEHKKKNQTGLKTDEWITVGNCTFHIDNYNALKKHAEEQELKLFGL